MATNPWLSTTTQLQATPPPPPDVIRTHALVAPESGVPAAFTEAARVYSTLTAMADDGFTTSHVVYNAAEDLFNNSDRAAETPVRRIVVVRRQTAVAQVSQFDVTDTSDGNHTLSVNGTVVATFAASTSTATQIKDGLVASFSLTGYAAASVDTDSGSVTGPVGLPFTLTYAHPGPGGVGTVSTTTPPVGIYDDLDAAFPLYPFWGVCPAGQESDVDLSEALRWCRADTTNRRNFMIGQQADTGLADSGDTDNTALTWQAAAYKRALLITHPSSTEYMAAAAIGRLGGGTPGGRAWHYIELFGSTEVTLSPNRTDSQLTTLKARNVSYTARFSGPTSALRLYWGATPNGNFISQVWAEDWWWYIAKTAIDAKMASNAGVDLNAAGLQSLVDEVTTASLTLVNAGVLDPDFTVTATDLSTIPAGELATGDFQTTGKITLSGQLTRKLRSLAVVAEFAV